MRVKFIMKDGKDWSQELNFPILGKYLIPKGANGQVLTEVGPNGTIPMRMSIYYFFRNEDGTFEFREE